MFEAKAETKAKKRAVCKQTVSKLSNTGQGAWAQL